MVKTLKKILFNNYCIAVCFLTVFYASTRAQTVYSGNIGTFPVEFVIDKIKDSAAVNGVYLYKKYNEPIILDGTIENFQLALKEKNDDGSVRAVFLFDNFNEKAIPLSGTWKKVGTTIELPVALSRLYDVDPSDTSSGLWENREVLQTASLDNYFFKLVVARRSVIVSLSGPETVRKDSVIVMDVRIYSKKTGEVFQNNLLPDPQATEIHQGIKSISIDDYNFDGTMDFSLYYGKHLSLFPSQAYRMCILSRCFVFGRKSKKFKTLLLGYNLSTNMKHKTIIEKCSAAHCCDGAGGLSVIIYKVNNNDETFMIEESCYSKYLDTNTQKAKTGIVYYQE